MRNLVDAVIGILIVLPIALGAALIYYGVIEPSWFRMIGLDHRKYAMSKCAKIANAQKPKPAERHPLA